jgi:predicted  nucleic acid-binding Zn-ribbon protein
MDPGDKAVIEDKLNALSSEVASAKKPKSGDEAKEAYDLDRYKNSKLFQKFMKQEGVTILQKPPIVKPPAKGPSPPPVPDPPMQDEDYNDQPPDEDYGYQEAEEDRGGEVYEQNQGLRLQKSGTGSIDVELEGYSEHIPPSPARAQMFGDLRSSYQPQVQPGLYPAPPAYGNPYYYQPSMLSTGMNPMGLPPVPPLGSMLPSLEMQLYFKQMMDMYQQSNPPVSSRDTFARDTGARDTFARDTGKEAELLAELETRDKEIRKLQRELESKQLDVMKLEDQLREIGLAEGDPGRMQELMAEMEGLQKRYEATEDELISTQRECDKAKDELAALKSKKTAPVDDSQTQDKIIQLEYKLEGALDKVAVLEKALAKEKDINIEAERRMEVARSRIAKLEEGIEDLKIETERKVEDAEETKREATQLSRKLQKELELARGEIDALRSANERLKTQQTRSGPPPRESYRRSPEPERPDSYSPQEPVRKAAPKARGREDYYQEEPAYQEPPRREYQQYEEPVRPATSRPSAYEDYEPPQSSRKGPSSGLTHFDMVRNVENKLIALQMEKDRVEIEYNKIPEHSKTISQRRRREDLAQELDLLNTNINSLKSKLRTLNSRT